MKRFLFCFFFMTYGMSMSMAHEIEAKVSLSPAGSFSATATNVMGAIKKVGNKYTCDSMVVTIANFKTGIDLRNDHLYKHFNVNKFPKIEMKKIAAENGKGSGDLIINGVAKKIEFGYKAISEKKLEAQFKFIPSEFKLPEAKYLEIGVEDEVEIVVKLDL